MAAPDGTDAPARGCGAEQVVAARQLLGRLAAKMPAAELEVLVMTRFDCMSQDEVAEVTATSSRQVRRILVRAEHRLGELEEALK